MTGYDALRDAAAVVEHNPRGQVHVTGADAKSFLQSLLSQDLAPLEAGQGAHALLLQPQGKLEAELRVLIVGPDDVWLDGEDPPAIVAALTRFKIRVDVTLSDATADRAWLSVRGPEALAAVAAACGVALPASNHAFVTVGDVLVVRADWPGNLGVDILGPIDAVEAVRARLALPVADVDAVDRLRIECGIPRQGIDMDAATIPQEALLERDAISFTKGCFLGQELVCRIDSRGHVNRLLRIVELPAPVAPGTTVTRDGTDVGTVTSVAATATGAIALATLRREVEPGATVVVASGDSPLDGLVVAVPEA